MNNTFTLDDFILLLYNEVDPLEKAELEAELEWNWELAEEYESLKAVKSAMNDLKRSPSKTSVDIIMQYSSETALEASC